MFRHFGLAGVDFQSHCRRRRNPVPSRGRAIVLFIHIGGSGQVLINWHNFVTGEISPAILDFGHSVASSWTSRLRGSTSPMGCPASRQSSRLHSRALCPAAGACAPRALCVWNVWPGSPLFGREREQTRFLHPARAVDPEHRPVGTWRQPTCSSWFRYDARAGARELFREFVHSGTNLGRRRYWRRARSLRRVVQ